MAADSTAAHLRDEDLAAYLERVLSAPSQTSVQAHLADCEQCRDRLMFASQVITRTATATGRRPRIRPLWLAALAMAAGLTGVLLLPRSPAREVADPAEFRAPPHELEPRQIRAYAPLRNGTLRTDTLRLTWSAAGDEAAYQVTLSAADGRLLWSRRVTDTSVVPPPDIADQLRRGERYFWRVDALLPDLGAMTTGEQPFQVGGP